MNTIQNINKVSSPVVLLALLVGAIFLFGVQFIFAAPSPAPQHITTTGNTTTMTQGGKTITSSDFNRDGKINGPNEVSVTNDRGGNNNGSGGTPSKPACPETPDIAVTDILFVKAGTLPNSPTSTVTETKVSGWGVSAPKGTTKKVTTYYVGVARPADDLIISANNLEAGVSYQPIVQLRNLNCNPTYAIQTIRAQALAQRSFIPTIAQLLAFITPATASANGGGSQTTTVSPTTPTLVGYHINQTPFGSNGSFPVRLHIDYGQDGSVDYDEYLNSQGPIGGVQTTFAKAMGVSKPGSFIGKNPNKVATKSTPTIYIPFPPFTARQSGNHNITANADVTNTQAPGHGCTSMMIPKKAGVGFIKPGPAILSSIDWGCINEKTPAGTISETNNNLTKTFTISNAQILQVTLADIHVRVGGTLTTVPFDVQNRSTSTLPGYTYTIKINGTGVGAGTRTLTFAPDQIDSVLGGVTYTIPSSPTTVPLEVCATSALLATTSCSVAQVIVSITQCSDGVDNDSDGTIDALDTGCYTNPLDPSTYDENDDSEGGIIDLPPPTLLIWSDSPLVRYNGQATINYSITAAYPITCTVTGGGINETINHTPGTTTGAQVSTSLKNKQQFILSCPGFTTATTRLIDSAESLTIEVVPLLQEV